MSKLIYIADDEKDILNLVQMFLESEGYVVEKFDTGDDLYDKFIEKPCDLIVLDIMMPGTDGLTICNKIRKLSTVPIILLTAKDTDSDYIAGITLGSDDYLTKPFRPTMLIMRIKSLLRRVEMSNDIEKNEENKDLKCGDLTYSIKKHAILKGDKEIKFTSMELACMSYLMEYFEEVVSRESLLENVWGYDKAVETRVTDETIRRIRKKIASAKSNVSIKNKWGYGYVLVEEK